ncbi:MAG: DUF3551 domain-containing protein [Bradyrhizobiaceae bacterium]|nr:MAG: DUF3551 domain-containing protein [Bradyrhizobiaceae bacterium]
MNGHKIILAAVALAALSAFGAAPATAKDYPFCRNTGGGPGDCRYDTLEQCQTAVSETGSYCQPNYWLSQTGQSSQQPRPRRTPRS